MVQEEPEGFSTEAALCLLYNGLILYLVLTAVALSMVLTGHKRRYTARRAMITDPNAPLCECGQYKCQKINVKDFMGTPLQWGAPSQTCPPEVSGYSRTKVST